MTMFGVHEGRDMDAELPFGVVLMDEHGHVLANNGRAAELLRLSEYELRSDTPPRGWKLCDDAGAPLIDSAELAAQVLRTETTMSIPLVVTRDAEPNSRVWAEYYPVHHRGKARVVIMLQPVRTDVARGKGLIDPLTELPGRALLLDRLDQSLVRARTRGTLSTLVLMDVCQLSQYNQRHGIPAGDELLSVLATRLRETLRADDTVARYGGDEFAIVAEHPTGTGKTIAQRAYAATTPALSGDNGHQLVDLRVAWVTTDGHTPAHTILERAAEQLRD